MWQYATQFINVSDNKKDIKDVFLFYRFDDINYFYINTSILIVFIVCLIVLMILFC